MMDLQYIRQIEAENVRLKSALDFYADERNYVQLRAHESPHALTVPRDSGNMARNVLKGIKLKPTSGGA